jgi:hypothetical protein
MVNGISQANLYCGAEVKKMNTKVTGHPSSSPALTYQSQKKTPQLKTNITSSDSNPEPLVPQKSQKPVSLAPVLCTAPPQEKPLPQRTLSAIPEEKLSGC